ncbi:bacteriocin-type signal sequence-containing protein [Chryseobacterium arachidis]|uniref:Bacteriocin-type signal sequence-containing protein n=1 Tax=Chryseobacterium arachidis TaxID=1416778 RepID=A0A1M5CYU3_9FLAO|nr:bacteriocin-type signal sequence-containing protein [Chryseobacterium arachidis]
MKNLRKLTKKELKSVNGGIQGCYYLIDGTKVCPCNPHTHRDCYGKCIPIGQMCAVPQPEL